MLREGWGLRAARVEVLSGGMNSAAWEASGEGWRVAVKSVPAADTGFGPGLQVAERLSAAGIVSGRPRPSTAGRLSEVVDGRQVAVLEFVEGEPLAYGKGDQRAIGVLLGRVHGVLREPAGDLEEWLSMATVFAEYFDYEEWVEPAVRGALDGVRALPPLTWAWLHGDPAPEAFLRQADGELGLIDWGSASRGPVLYDVASAVMYLGGPAIVVPAYLTQRPELAAELEGLEAFLRLRYAVQAGYFAWRCAERIGTGLDDLEGNRIGLTHAREFFR
ncbi:hypothetical protein GCM10009534_66530 [Kribbella sandramycini]